MIPIYCAPRVAAHSQPPSPAIGTTTPSLVFSSNVLRNLQNPMAKFAHQSRSRDICGVSPCTCGAPVHARIYRGPAAWLTHAALTSMFADGGPSAWLTVAAQPAMFTDGGPSAWLTRAALPSMFADGGPSARLTPAPLPSVRAFLAVHTALAPS